MLAIKRAVGLHAAPAAQAQGLKVCHPDGACAADGVLMIRRARGDAPRHRKLLSPSLLSLERIKFPPRMMGKSKSRAGKNKVFALL